MAIAEKLGLLVSADAFIAARKLRNALVHEYMNTCMMLKHSWRAFSRHSKPAKCFAT